MGGVFLIGDDGGLVEMAEQDPPSESLLQELLAKYPNLLAGDQIDSDEPRRWLLISREAALPSEEEGPDRWSVDHLFLDQDAVPTLVEVKRSRNTEIRRHVVGQMLDYAANAVVYWPVDEIRAKFEARCVMQELDPEETLSEFLGGEASQEEFWQKAKTNMQAGKIRLLFVADEIPSELRRVVEFLNEQMDPAEVLAVEIKQYVGQNQRVLVPRVFGQTAEKEPPPPKEWDEPSFFQSLEENCGEREVEAARRILDWTRSKGLSIRWGTGRIRGSFSPFVEHKEVRHYIIYLWDNGSIAIEFVYLKKRPPFNSESRRRELRDRLNRIPGVSIPEDRIGGEPSIRLSNLIDEAALREFLLSLDWLVQEIRAS